MIGKYVPLIASSLRRKKLRTFFTIASILIAFLLFGLAESMRHALEAGVNVAGADRLLVMHKVSFTQFLPASYENRIRGIDGVADVTPHTWFGARFGDVRNQIPAFPVKPEAYLGMYPEYVIAEDQKQAWLADRSGILIGRAVADLYSLKPGDAVPLNSAIWQNVDGSYVWEVTVRAIYDAPAGGDTRNLAMHQEYFEEARVVGKGLVGWYLVKVRDPGLAQSVSRQIDQSFANSPAETKTSSERSMAQSFVNQVGNIGKILRAIVTAVFFTMLLVTANTMAQSVRERTSEIGVLKTLGFTSTGVLWMVLVESVLVTVVGGVLGLAAAWWLGVQFEPVFRQYLPSFHLPWDSILAGVACMLALGFVAGAVPAAQAMRLRIVEALRRD